MTDDALLVEDEDRARGDALEASHVLVEHAVAMNEVLRGSAEPAYAQLRRGLAAAEPEDCRGGGPVYLFFHDSDSIFGWRCPNGGPCGFRHLGVPRD